jgi:predicted GNAT family N-acyltransferase
MEYVRVLRRLAMSLPGIYLGDVHRSCSRCVVTGLNVLRGVYNMDVHIRELEKDDYMQYIDVIGQLRPVDRCVSKEEFSDVYDAIFKSNKIFVALYDNNIVGSITLIIEQKFIHKLAIYTRIEDVVVDESHRNNRIGYKLVQHAIDYSNEIKSFKITLTCKKYLEKFYNRSNFSIYDIHMSQLVDVSSPGEQSCM